VRFCLIHVDDHDGGPEEEALVVVPGAAKAAFAIPLDSLPAFLPLLAQAAEGLDQPACSGCGSELPG
jgi:hypothetical protein